MPVQPDLTRASARVEALMQDACVVTHDPYGDEDSFLDEETGDLYAPAGEPEVVYSGKCLIKATAQTVMEENGAFVVVNSYDAFLPLAAPMLATGDLFTVTAAARDAVLVGREMAVVSSVATSMPVVRVVRLEERTASRPVVRR